MTNLVTGSGLFSSAALFKFLSIDGTQWIGKNGKWNSLNWGGNQWTGPRSEVLRRVNKIRAAGQGLFVVGTGFSLIEGANAFVNRDTIGVVKSGTDIGFGTAATFGGTLGLVGGSSYFATSALLNYTEAGEAVVTFGADVLCYINNNC